MRSRKSVLLTLVIASLLVSLVATQCAPATKAPPTEKPTAEEKPTEKPAEKVKIVHWSMFSEGEPLQKLLDQATQDFMKENPDIEVEVKWAGRQVLTLLQSAIAAGTQVDIIDQSDDRVYNAIVKTGLALPLDEYLDEKAYDSDKPWRDTFIPSALDLGKAPDGKVYMMARDDYIAAFFYDVKMLDELGLKPHPTDITWEEFLNMLETIKEKKPGVSPIGVDTSIGFLNNWYFTYLAIRLAGKDAFRDAAYDKTGEKWGDPEFLQAAQMVREISDKGYFQDKFEGSVWPSAQVLWVNGKTAMMFMGAWLPSEMSEQMPQGFEPAAFAFPSVEGGKGNGLVEYWANVYAVLNSTKHPDAAVKYLKYISTKKVGTEISKLGTPSPIIGVPAARGLENQPKILETFEIMPARAGLDTEIPEYMANVYNACDDQLFKLQIGPQEFIECLKAEAKTFWATK